MEDKSQLARSGRPRKPRSTRNQAPKYTHKRKQTTSKAESSSRNPRTINRVRTRSKSRSNVKITDEQRISILQVFNKDLRFSKKDADVGSSESIIKLAKKMNVSSIEMCDWLGMTDELNEILDHAYLPAEQINSTLEKFVANLGSNGSSPEDDGSNLADESEDKMDEVPCPDEMPKSMEISNDLNKVSACSSDQETGSENPSNVKLTELQKNFILKSLKRDLGSNWKVLKVGSAKHIQELADKLEMSTMDMRELLGITDQVIADSSMKVRGFERPAKALEEKGSTELKDACPEKFREVEGGLKVITENCQEPEEEMMPKLASPVSEADEDSKSLDQNDKRLLAEMAESDEDEGYELAAQSFHEAWAGEMKEYLRVSPAYEDGNALECEMLKTAVGNKPVEMEVDMERISGKGTPEAPAAGSSALRSTSEPTVAIKRKTRIDDYFPALKSMKKD